MINEELELYENIFEIIKQKDNSIIYRVQDTTGIGSMRCYEVFKGIVISYNDFHMKSYFSKSPSKSDNIEINHCREGRIECEFPNGSYSYLAEGDVSINVRGARAIGSSFPLSHYHGISIAIDLKRAEEVVNSCIDGVLIDFSAIQSKFSTENKFFIMRAKDSIQHIFSELYTIPNEVKNMYFKLKVLELLLFLSISDINEGQEQRKYFPKQQVETIKKIMNYITEHMEEHITLVQLSQKFDIGITSMKQCFKGVYGTSIYSFIRNYRIQKATLMLKETNESVSKIASKVGYDNSSKFAAAFKATMNVNPLEYRKTVM